MSSKTNVIEKSIVQIFADHNYPSYAQPWSFLDHQKSGSTGFCVELPGFITDRWRSGDNSNKYIITNAHCVHGSSYIKIRKRGESTLYRFRMESIIYECDLAILSMDTSYYLSSKQKQDLKTLINEFWDNVLPLELGGLPAKMDTVYVYGYPLGGHNISVTSGSINRIQTIKYYEIVYGIAIQIDAPINFGNSGGPVVDSSGLVIGIAFSGEDDRFTQNMGYIIPVALIKFFLKSVVASKKFRGLCSLEIGYQNLDNAVIREYLQAGDKPGILINSVGEFGCSAGHLQRMDIITHIDDKPVANDGAMTLSDVLREVQSNPSDLESGEIVPFGTYISLKLPGDSVKLKVIRNATEVSVSIKLKPKPFLVPILEYQISPSYFVITGFVFIPLSLMVIDEKTKEKEYVSHLISYYTSQNMQKKDEQIIILAQKFESEVTEGFEFENNVLKSVNGIDILNLEHLFRTVKAEVRKSKTMLFEFRDTGNIIIIDCQDYIKNQKTIISKNLGDIPEYSPS